MTRSQRRTVLAGLLATALVVALAAVGLSGGGDDGAGDGPRTAGAAEVAEMLEGIPQDGVALGRADAPVTLVEFADPQCPFCHRYSLDAMPVVIERYVRTGKLRMELRMLAFLGPDSAKAARVIQAAAAQDRLWNVLDLAYWNQGRENSGYVTEAWLRSVLGAVPGLDGERVLRDAAGRPVREALARAERDARRWQVAGTPAFLLGATGGTPRKVGEQALSADALGTEIDALLGDDAR